MNRHLLFTAPTFAWGLHNLCRLHRIPFTAKTALHEIPPPYDPASLQRAALAFGLEGRWRRVQAAMLSRQTTPFLALLHPPATDAAGPAPGCGLALVLRCEPGRVTCITDERPDPVTCTLEEFSTRYAGEILAVSPVDRPHGDADPAAAARPAFGFGWFVPELLRHRAIWRDVLLASLAIQMLALATPVFTQIVIDKVIVHRTTNTLVVIGVALAVFIAFTAVMSWARQYLVLHTGNRIDAVLGSQVFEHLFQLPLRYFEHRPTGTLVARLQGVETIREFLSGAAVTLILDVPFLLIFLAMMFWYSGLLTLITLAILGLIALLSAAVTPLLRERINRQFLAGARNQAFVTEYVAGMETVKSLQMEPQLGQRYGDYLASYLQASFNTRQLANAHNVAAQTLEQLLTLAILCAGAWIVMNDMGMTIGMLVAFQMFASRISGPVLRMVGLWQEFQQASIAVKRLGDIMDASAEPYSSKRSREGGGKGRIEIRNLSFRYADNLPYLYRHFDVTIEPGECVALMGPSGCGKSTLAKLLQAFYLPTDGAILLDGHDIRHLSANELRQHFGVVPQETTLFSGTIYDNLVLANPHASFEHVIQACKMAEIHDAIERLPEGYRTPIGEHGAGLSGGQKQRLAIARALLRRPRILIFDEATSNLDPDTAAQFAKTVNRIKGKVTMLFIAHQLPSGLQVDRVLTLGSVHP